MKIKCLAEGFQSTIENRQSENGGSLPRGYASQARFGTGMLARACKNAQFRVPKRQNPHKIGVFPQAEGYKIASIGMKLIFFEEETWQLA
jgi:hypothetical protein